MRQLQHVQDRFVRETRGQPMLILGREVTLIGRVTKVAWPGGGFLVHRPLVIEVSQKETTRRYPIPNGTRRTLALFLLDLAVVALALGARRWLVLERNAS